MSKYTKFKSKYKKIPIHGSVFNPEPWLEYPWLIEEIKSLEETLEKYCKDGIQMQ